jgi:hypothetical protein
MDVSAGSVRERGDELVEKQAKKMKVAKDEELLTLDMDSLGWTRPDCVYCSEAKAKGMKGYFMPAKVTKPSPL